MYAEEEETASKLLRAIDLAQKQVIPDPDRAITRLEQEKLCYFAIKEFELPITYSWYIEGAYTRVSGEPDKGNKRIRDRNPSKFEDIGEDPDVLKYRDYFTSTIFFDTYTFKDIWLTERLEFLHDFYTHEAPEQFRELYLASLGIRRSLKTFLRDLSVAASNKSLAEFTDNPPVRTLIDAEDERELREHVSRFHLALTEHDDLQDIIPLVTAGTDIVEQVIAQLTAIDTIDNEQESVIRGVEQFFYSNVWQYPSLFISIQTATGPNRHHLIDEHVTRFTESHEQLHRKIKRQRNHSFQAGLYPDTDQQAEKVDVEIRNHLNSIMVDYLEGRPDVE